MASRGSFVAGLADFSREAQAAIDSASVIPREPDDNGPRTFVLSPSLGGAFVFTREDATTRIRRAFPELSERGVKRAVQHLKDRVSVMEVPPQHIRRRSWVHGWAEEN